MSVLILGKTLHTLTYSEMQVVSKKLADRLGIDQTTLADALLEVGAQLAAEPNTGEEQEVALLRAVFSRKRAINVQTVNRQFLVTMATSKVQTASPSLAAAIDQLLDNLVATQAMGLKP